VWFQAHHLHSHSILAWKRLPIRSAATQSFWPNGKFRAFMKIAVIGAGVVGICTAYELAQDGHAVSVYEGHGSVAEEASFACAGHVSPSLSHPLSFPPWPQASNWRALLKPAGIALGRATSPGDLRWLARWKTGSSNFLERFQTAQQLLAYSLARQLAISSQSDLAFDQSQGQLYLLRTDSDVQAAQERLATLKALGVAAQMLSNEQARALEPALGSDIPLQAALYFPNDAAGNCRQFAHALKDQAQALGVNFHFATTVTALSHTPQVLVHTSQGTQSFEQIVVCTGAGAAPLLRPALKHVALTRVGSHSLSAQIREPLNAPRSAVVDGQVCISRLGARIRVSGGAELGGSPLRKRAASTRLLYDTLQTHFPGAADFSRSMQLWSGSSLFSPDALPLLGPSGLPGIWLNLAHGHNGWGMACGAARILADQVLGKDPDLNTTLLHPGRFKP
jgi:D-amino-acid dehydrogenase